MSFVAFNSNLKYFQLAFWKIIKMHQLNLINNSEFWPRHDARHFSFLFWVYEFKMEESARVGGSIPYIKAQLKGILWVIKILATSFLFHEIILIKRNLIWFKAICLCVHRWHWRYSRTDTLLVYSTDGPHYSLARWITQMGINMLNRWIKLCWSIMLALARCKRKN